MYRYIYNYFSTNQQLDLHVHMCLPLAEVFQSACAHFFLLSNFALKTPDLSFRRANDRIRRPKARARVWRPRTRSCSSSHSSRHGDVVAETRKGGLPSIHLLGFIHRPRVRRTVHEVLRRLGHKIFNLRGQRTIEPYLTSFLCRFALCRTIVSPFALCNNTSTFCPLPHPIHIWRNQEHARPPRI